MKDVQPQSLEKDIDDSKIYTRTEKMYTNHEKSAQEKQRRKSKSSNAKQSSYNSYQILDWQKIKFVQRNYRYKKSRANVKKEAEEITWLCFQITKIAFVNE